MDALKLASNNKLLNTRFLVGIAFDFFIFRFSVKRAFSNTTSFSSTISFSNAIFAFNVAFLVLLLSWHPSLHGQTAAQRAKASSAQAIGNVSNTLLPSQGIRRIQKLYRPTDTINFSDLPIVYNNGVLFTFYGQDDDQVFVSGTFYDWQKQLKMQKGQFGIYYAFLEKNLLPGSYSYRFKVNGLWQNDQAQPLTRFDESFRKVSYFTLVEPVHYHKVSPVHLGEKVFRFYLEDKGYRSVAWIASANRLDPRVSPMRLQGKYWVIERRMEQEATFYAYHIDGQLMLDPKNPYISSTPFHIQLNYIPIHLFQTDK